MSDVVLSESPTISTEFLEFLVAQNGVHLEEISNKLATNNELLAHMYATMLYVIGIGGAVFVLFVLYKFLRKFF